jgi:hypothetical protein
MDRGSSTTSRYAPDQERSHHLSLLIGQEWSAWAAHHVEHGTVEALSWGRNDQALRDDLLPHAPLSVSFVSLPEWSTLVPDAALLPGSEAQHLKLVHGGIPTGAMRDEPIASLAATCIYVHDDLTERAVLQRFPHARALPLHGVLLRAAEARHGSTPLVLAHRSADRLDVHVMREGRLVLSNSYPARSVHDVLYFTLLAADVTGLDAQTAEVQLCGTHIGKADLDLVRRYFPFCIPASGPGWSELKPAVGTAPERWLAALEQFACVS